MLYEVITLADMRAPVSLGMAMVAMTAMILFIAIPLRTLEERPHERPRLNLGATLAELREGWQFMFINPVVLV